MPPGSWHLLCLCTRSQEFHLGLVDRFWFTKTFDFCLSTSIPVLTTSTYVVAWPQGDQLLGGGPWHKANLPATHWLSLPFYTPEGARRLSWRIPAPTGSSQMGTPRGLRTPAELSPQPSFPTPPPPVFLLQLRHFLPVFRPWWSASAPFTSPAAAAAAASAKDKADASAAAAAKANASVMTRAVDWLRQSRLLCPAHRSRLRSCLRSRLRSRLRSHRRTCGRTKGGRLCCRSAVPNAQQLWIRRDIVPEGQ